MGRYPLLFKNLINEGFEDYLDKIKNEKEWVGEVEMRVLSMKYKISFVVYYEVNKPPLTILSDVTPLKTITLACTNGNHYDCVYTKKELSVLAFCQSIVYEVLYKHVFELGSDVDIAVEKMLHDKAYSKQRRNNLLAISQLFRDSCRIEGIVEDPNLPEEDQSFKNPPNPRLEIRKALSQGVPPFPYKVAKTLDPSIYRNVEFDLWNEKRKEEQKQEQFITPKLEAGVKCKVYINKEVYVGHIQEVFDDSDDVCIYIEALCKRCVVSSSVLEIVPVPAYKALTWQGGKTYKVYSDCVQAGSDVEKCKYKRYYKKNSQELSPHKDGIASVKPNAIPRSNSMPASTNQRSAIPRSNSLYCSPQLPPRKNSNSKHKNHLPKDPLIRAPVLPNQSIPFIWTGASSNNSTSPIPIPGKIPIDPYHPQLSPSEMSNEANDPGWMEESPVKSQATSPPPHAAIYPEEVHSFAATSMPLPIPGAQEDPGYPQPQPLTLYQYPVYAVPSMYLVCRDGSTLPVTWTAQEPGCEVPAGIPSVYINTPPTGMSPPMASWIPATIPNYGSTWPPAMTSVAFTPPGLDAYQAMMSPPWSPAYMAPPMAYQMQPPRMVHPSPELTHNG